MVILHALDEEEGITVLMVTHDPEVAASTERVVSMRDGALVADQTSDEYVQERRLAARGNL